MSKCSNKKRIKQLRTWLDNELNFGKGAVRVRNKKGHYIKVSKKDLKNIKIK
tara:strand:+ start:520 stop:675 length:156 start_codon:yes stop_codon:yes gene_type:complete